MQPQTEGTPQAYTLDAQTDAASQQEDLRPVASIPWVAIALALHMIVLVVAWFIMPHVAPPVTPRVLDASTEQIAMPPKPELKPEVPDDWPQDRPETTVESREDQIAPDPTDVINEDPTDQPHDALAEPDTRDKSESPHPSRENPNSSLGLGGGASGGKGNGGAGGLSFRRTSHGGPRKKKQDREVDAALQWLADHQNRQGYWSATTFSADSTRTGARRTYNRDFVRVGDPKGDQGWDNTVDIGLTGMAILAFTGDGQTHKQGKHAFTIRQALNWLTMTQSNDGCFGPKEDDHFVYNHAIATMALCEIYGLDVEPALLPRLIKAVQFILDCQNPGAGWRYGVKPMFNDSSVTGWMVLTLHTAQMCGIEFDRSHAYDDAAKWFTAVTASVGGYAKTGYDSPGGNCARLRTASAYENVPSMDSIGIMSLLFMDKADVKDANIRSQAQAIVQQLPEWKLEKLDYYYWYYASLALYQVGGSTWERWEKPMTQALLNSQRGLRPDEKGESAASLDEFGSWDPIDAWGSAGGRVYATAINCLTMQVWERYERGNGKAANPGTK